MSLLPEVKASYHGIILPLFKEKISSGSSPLRTGNEGMTVDAIILRDDSALLSKFNNDLKDKFTNELKTAFTTYKTDFEKKQREIKDTELKIKQAKLKVSSEGNTSGSDSEGQVSASSIATTLRIQLAKLIEERSTITKHYTDTVKEVNNAYANLLYDFYLLTSLSRSVASKGAGRGKTRKYRNKKTRRKNAMRDSMALEKLRRGRR